MVHLHETNYLTSCRGSLLRLQQACWRPTLHRNMPWYPQQWRKGRTWNYIDRGPKENAHLRIHTVEAPVEVICKHANTRWKIVMKKSETKTAFSATKVVRHLRPRAKHVVGGLDGLDGFDGEASWPAWSWSAAPHCWTMTKHDKTKFPSISIHFFGFFQVYCLHSTLVHPFSCCLHSCPCSSRYISFFHVLLLFFYVFLMRTRGAYGLWHFHSGRV